MAGIARRYIDQQFRSQGQRNARTSMAIFSAGAIRLRAARKSLFSMMGSCRPAKSGPLAGGSEWFRQRRSRPHRCDQVRPYQSRRSRRREPPLPREGRTGEIAVLRQSGGGALAADSFDGILAATQKTCRDPMGGATSYELYIACFGRKEKGEFRGCTTITAVRF